MNQTRTSAGKALLGIACGSLLAVLLLGRSTSERRLLESRSTRFREFTDTEKHNLLLSHKDFLAQSPERQQQLRDIHHAALAEPELHETLLRFGNWWKQLSRPDWDTWMTLSTENRLTFVQEHWTTSSTRRTSDQVEIRFPEAYARRLPTLHLTTSECLMLVSTMVPEQDRPDDVQSDLLSLNSDGHKALRLNLFLFEKIQNARQSSEQVQKATTQILALKSILLNDLNDAEWSAAFTTAVRPVEGRSWEVGWLTPIVYSIFSQCALKLGSDLLQEFPVSEAQILSEFEKITSEQQRELMTMSPAQAKGRLEFLAQTDAAEGPEQQLLQRYAEFAGHQDRLLRSVSFGLGPPGGNSTTTRPNLPPARRQSSQEP